MEVKLVALSGPRAGETFPLDKNLITLGRDSGNDVVVDADWISRKHCEIRKSSEGYTLVDLDSHNGTAVNDVPIKERLLQGGDRVMLPGASFLFVDSDVEPPPAVELLDLPLPERRTVRLRAEDALYLNPRRLPDDALGKTLSFLQLLEGEIETLPDRILDHLFALVPAERGAILVGAVPDELEPIAARAESRPQKGRFPVSRTVLEKVFAERTAFMSNNAGEEVASKSLLAAKVTSLVALPLLTDGRVIGAIYLDRRSRDGEFPEAKLELLMGLASVAATALDRARQLGKLRAANQRLQQELGLAHDMVGESPRLKEAQRVLAKAAPTDATVLIEGESGTGKELAARAIHFNSPRRDRPLVKVDCTGLNENLLASELFGHERGAFTGAIQQKKGKLEVADGGTVFLDEIGELPISLQAHLLRVLQDREFERVGGTRPIAVDIRLVAATNRDLAREVKEGRFRADLFHRLNVVRLSLPPLRERPGDVELLAQFYASEHGKRVKRHVAGIAPEALAILKRYDWPGNVRELANTIERAVVLGTTELILPEDLPESMVEQKNTSGPATSSYHEAVAERKRDLILDAVGRATGSITDAAKLLGLHPNYLHRLIRNLGLRDRLKDT
jgi:Nif-specific regulatory protein